MQQSQNEHWRGRVKPGSSFSSRMLPYAAGAAIGATLTAALLWGTYNAGRTKGYSYAPDSQQQAAQQENYRLKKTADNPGKTAAKAPATIKTAAALHGEQRNNTAYRNPVCSSDYPQFKPRIDSEVPEKIKKTFDRLGVPEAERAFFAGVGAQYDSETIYHNIHKELEDQGVIFMDTGSALNKYPKDQSSSNQTEISRKQAAEAPSIKPFSWTTG